MVAAIRSPSHTSTETLTRLAIGPSSTLVVLKIDNTVDSNAATAIKLLQSEHNITHLNTVTANAEISNVGAYVPVARVKIQDVKDNVDFNAIGRFVLLQAVLLLLQKSTHAGTFVTLSSLPGDIEAMEQCP